MGDELRGDSLVHLNVRFSTEAELKQTLDFLYEKSKEGIAFTGLVEAMVNEVTIITAIHNIKSNKGSKTAGVDRLKMDKYLQMPKEELIALIRDNFSNYRKEWKATPTGYSNSSGQNYTGMCEDCHRAYM